MALNLNPMGLTSGVWPGNHIAPNTAAPASNPAIASYPVGTNVLNIAALLPRYVDPGISAKDDPQGTIRGHL
jgi:hypothetical protein